MDKIKVKVRPAGTHAKIQYEGEELTIKELVGKLEYLKGSQEYLKWVVVEREKEIALLKRQLAEAQAAKHGRWIYDERTTNTLLKLTCSKCGWWTINQPVNGLYNYCPECGAKMDDKDINVPTKSGMEEEYDG